MTWQLMRFAAPQLTSLQQWRGLAPLCVGLAARWASTGADSAAIVVPMPKLSPSMTEGTVSKWLKVGLPAVRALRMHAACTSITGRFTTVCFCCRHQGMQLQSSMWSWRWTQRGSQKRRTKSESSPAMSPCWLKPRQGLPHMPQCNCMALHGALLAYGVS